jgi:Protein of unknown function (DUF559)
LSTGREVSVEAVDTLYRSTGITRGELGEFTALRVNAESSSCAAWSVWERWWVIVEYDGDHHFEPEQRNRDIERWNALEAAGWRVIRVKARQLVHGRATLIAQVTRVLRDAGAPV